MILRHYYYINPLLIHLSVFEYEIHYIYVITVIKTSPNGLSAATIPVDYFLVLRRTLVAIYDFLTLLTQKICRHATGQIDKIPYIVSHIYWWLQYKNSATTTSHHQNFKLNYSMVQLKIHPLLVQYHYSHTIRLCRPHALHHITIPNRRRLFVVSRLLHTLWPYVYNRSFGSAAQSPT